MRRGAHLTRVTVPPRWLAIGIAGFLAGVLWSARAVFQTMAELPGDVAIEPDPGEGLARSSAWETAVALAQNDPRVIEALGTPVTADPADSIGTLHSGGKDGAAKLLIALSGPQGSVRVRAIGQRREGRWTFAPLDARFFNAAGEPGDAVPPDQ